MIIKVISSHMKFNSNYHYCLSSKCSSFFLPGLNVLLPNQEVGIAIDVVVKKWYHQLMHAHETAYAIHYFSFVYQLWHHYCYYYCRNVHLTLPDFVHEMVAQVLKMNDAFHFVGYHRNSSISNRDSSKNRHDQNEHH